MSDFNLILTFVIYIKKVNFPLTYTVSFLTTALLFKSQGC